MRTAQMVSVQENLVRITSDSDSQEVVRRGFQRSFGGKEREAFAPVQNGFLMVQKTLMRLLSGKKKEHKPKLLSPDVFRWGGGLPREGLGAKTSVCPSKPREPNFFEECPGIFA